MAAYGVLYKEEGSLLSLIYWNDAGDLYAKFSYIKMPTITTLADRPGNVRFEFSVTGGKVINSWGGEALMAHNQYSRSVQKVPDTTEIFNEISAFETGLKKSYSDTDAVRNAWKDKFK